MAVDILMPKLGFSMDMGTVTEWLVKDGGQVTEGQPLYSLENEKAVEEIEAPGSGTLRILVPVGQACKVGSILGVIE